tara:strand:- start:1155 stop:1301 length:147 start_codon:yes stop_codon:yes gene_type:complete
LKKLQVQKVKDSQAIWKVILWQIVDENGKNLRGYFGSKEAAVYALKNF